MSIQTMAELKAANDLSSDLLLYIPSGAAVAGKTVGMNYLVTSSFGKLGAPSGNTEGGTTYSQDASVVGYPKWSPQPTKTAYISADKNTNVSVGTTHVYDLLWGVLFLQSSTLQTVTNFTGLPARAGTGKGCEIWIYFEGAPTYTCTATIKYTNNLGVGDRTATYAVEGGTTAVGRTAQLSLQDGDDGVQSIQSFQQTNGSAPINVYFLLMNRLCSFSSPVASIQQSYDAFNLGLPKIYDESCLFFVGQANGTTTGIIYSRLSIIHG